MYIPAPIKIIHKPILKKFLITIANIYIVIGFILLLSPIVYLTYHELTNRDKVEAAFQPEKETEILTQSLDAEGLEYNGNKEVNNSIPATEKSEHQYIQIPKIGIDTEIYEGDESALDNGIWRMPEKGRPYDVDQPTVLAGHRWGLETLTEAYRTKNLFYKLNELRPGDEIHITWDNTNYTYEVQTIEETKDVSHLTDLILITCKYYDSPTRIFVYAQKV